MLREDLLGLRGRAGDRRNDRGDIRTGPPGQRLEMIGGRVHGPGRIGAFAVSMTTTRGPFAPGPKLSVIRS
ncbi:hypothetical protein GCM10011588_17210 [Nocardia jinanensis]|uniref:Uncharacterized protein n=1 Tax=Nocardia jinanensis TaxID=382504 RepID=A0A917REZ6_9NOCA|nr:hypothetical protein GCM10011588_17210 [Nocardia jinanensis]